MRKATYFSQSRDGHLVDILDWASSEHGSETICFPVQYRRETYESLAEKSRDAATGLVHHGVKPGGVVGILFANCPNFVVSYFAALRARSVVAPLPGVPAFGRLETYLMRLRTMVEDVGIGHIVLEDAFAPFVSRCLDAEHVAIVPIGELVGTGTAVPDHDISPDDVAMVQYSSRRGARCRGRYLSHRSILGRLRTICEDSDLSPDDVNGQWLPLYHDLGLICMLAAMSCGMSQYVWPPLSFFDNPAGWLREFTRATPAKARRLGHLFFHVYDSEGANSTASWSYGSQRRHSML